MLRKTYLIYYNPTCPEVVEEAGFAMLGSYSLSSVYRHHIKLPLMFFGR